MKCHNHRTSYLENCKILRSPFWRENSNSYLVAKFATHESTLTVPHDRDDNIQILWKFFTYFSEKLGKNPKKTSYLENNKSLSSYIQMQDLQLPEITLTDSNNRIEIFNVLEFFNKPFLKISEKIIKKRHISKTTRIWAVIFGGKNRHSWEYPDRASLQIW